MSIASGEISSSTEGLSVVFITHNRPWALEIAVVSLKRALLMAGVTHEIIIADDGSDPRIWQQLADLPVDAIFHQPNWVYSDGISTIFDTMLAGYRMARYPYLLFTEDDFWFMPQGFVDVHKNHAAGLLSIPDYSTEYNPLRGGMQVLSTLPGAHNVELARSSSNPRYPVNPTSAVRFGNVRFAAKTRQPDTRWYTCNWPHLERTAEALDVPMPLGKPVWTDEICITQERENMFGPGEYTYVPERCFFTHVNIFSFRQMFHRRSEPPPVEFQWLHVEDSASLPYRFKFIPDFNQRLLQAFLDGKIRNDFDDYYSTSPMEYVYRRFHQVVAG